MTSSFVIPNARFAPGPEVDSWFRANWPGCSFHRVWNHPQGGFLVSIKALIEVGPIPNAEGNGKISQGFSEPDIATFHLKGEGEFGSDRIWRVEGPDRTEVFAKIQSVRDSALERLKRDVERERELIGRIMLTPGT